MSDIEAEPAADASPPPFIRRFSAPAGSPWNQARTVALEASHGAPLPAGQLEIVVRRIGPWRPGMAAEFAAAYFRKEFVGEEQRFSAELDGQTVEFVARGDGARQRAARTRLFDLGLVGASILALLLSGAAALGRRAELDARLREADVATQRHLQAGREARQRIADARVLDASGARGAQMTDALNDIVWLSRARQSQAVIDEIDWTPGEMRVASRGPLSPVATADRPINPTGEARPGGLRIWTIAPAVRTAP